MYIYSICIYAIFHTLLLESTSNWKPPSKFTFFERARFMNLKTDKNVNTYITKECQSNPWRGWVFGWIENKSSRCHVSTIISVYSQVLFIRPPGSKCIWLVVLPTLPFRVDGILRGWDNAAKALYVRLREYVEYTVIEDSQEYLAINDKK